MGTFIVIVFILFKLPFLNNFSVGYVSWIGHYTEKNSVLVDELLAYGAVLYVKTNVPQTLMVGSNLFKLFGFDY